MSKGFLSILLLLIIGFTSCDDGKIYPTTVVVSQSGSVYKVTATIKGVNGWHSDYDVALSSFSEDSEYAVNSKMISTSSDEETISVVLSGVQDVSTVELCVINQLRKRVITLYSMDYVDQEDTVYVDAGEIDATMFNAIQELVFDNDCIGCHGMSTSAAAGLYLTEGNSYDALVNVPASLSTEGKMRVRPSEPDSSFIMDVLTESGVVGNDHVDILSGKTIRLNLIENWIENGALED